MRRKFYYIWRERLKVRELVKFQFQNLKSIFQSRVSVPKIF